MHKVALIMNYSYLDVYVNMTSLWNSYIWSYIANKHESQFGF